MKRGRGRVPLRALAVPGAPCQAQHRRLASPLPLSDAELDAATILILARFDCSFADEHHVPGHTCPDRN